jgi:hypothetical protein
MLLLLLLLFLMMMMEDVDKMQHMTLQICGVIMT